MARNQNSSVLFNINIKGVQSAEQLSRTLPKLIKQFKDLAEAIERVNKAEENAGRGRGSKGISRGSVSDAISRVKLGIRKGDIQSVQQLTGHYGQLVSQINKLERSGENVNALRLRAFELYRKERREIEKTIKSKQQLNQANLAAASSTDGMRASMMQNIGSLNLTKNTLDQVERHTQRVADAQKNASYVILNAGYLIQDSPYGIRGMANNISQLAQSYQMLRERVEFLNRTQNANLTVWKSMKSLMMGPTGWILLLGSVLPAALEILNSKWDDWFGTQKDSNEEMERSIDLITSFVQAQRELRGGLGDDPLGILGMRQDISSLEDIMKDLQIVRQARDDLDSVREGIRGIEQAAPGFGAAVREHYSAPLEIASGIVETLEKRFGALSDIELEKLTDKISEMRAELVLSQDLLRRDPALQAQQQTSRIIAQLERDIDIFTEAGMDKAKENVRQNAMVFEDIWEESLKHFIKTGQMGLASSYSNALSNLRSLIEDSKKEIEELDVLNLDTPLPDDIVGNIQNRLDSITDLTAYQYERRIEMTEDVTEKVELVENSHQAKLARLRQMYVDDQFESEEEYQLARLQLEDKTSSTIDELWADHYEKLDRQRQKDIERERRAADLKRQLISNYAGFAINTGQAIANAADASARKQFNINKVASASQALVNGYLAYTKVLATTPPPFNIPLAKSTLLLAIGQAANIMSQSYDSARTTGRGGQGGSMIGYRGLNFAQSQMAQYNPFTGSAGVSQNVSRPSNTFPSEVTAKFVDGFGKVVSEGTLQLQRENKDDLGYWKDA